MAAAPPAPLSYRVVRLKCRHDNYKHLWNALPQQDKAFSDLEKRALKDIEAYKRDGPTPNRQGLEVLRLYAVLGDRRFEKDADGAVTRQLKYTDAAFWAPLQGLQKVRDDNKEKKFILHRLQWGTMADPEGLICSYAACCIPAPGSADDAGCGGGSPSYVVGFVCGYDPATQTYAVLHDPNSGDLAVLAEQRRRHPDEPAVQSAALAPRVFEVAAARLGSFPGKRCMTRQYVKGQEILARWEAAVVVSEPAPDHGERARELAEHAYERQDLREPWPRKTWKATALTTALYPAEIVGGSGLEHLQVRFLGTSGPAQHDVYVLHKRDVTLPPEAPTVVDKDGKDLPADLEGNLDEAELKRVRKARKKRAAEREAAQAKAGAAEDAAKAKAEGGMLLPAPRPTALAYAFPEGPLSYEGFPTLLTTLLSETELQKAAEWSVKVEAAEAAEQASPAPEPPFAEADGDEGGGGEGGGGEGGGGRNDIDGGGCDGCGRTCLEPRGTEDDVLLASAAVAANATPLALVPAEGDAAAPTPLRAKPDTSAEVAEAAAEAQAALEAARRAPSPPAPMGTVRCVATFSYKDGVAPPPLAPPSPRSDEAAARELAEWRATLGLPPLPPTSTLGRRRPAAETCAPLRLADASSASAPSGGAAACALVPRPGANGVSFGLAAKKRKKTAARPNGFAAMEEG